MIKYNRRSMVAALAALGFCTTAFAQVPPSAVPAGAGLNQVAPGVVARAPIGAAFGTPALNTNPAVSANNSALPDSDAATEQKHTLREINKKYAELALLKVQGEIAAAQAAGKPPELLKDPALALQQQLDTSKVDTKVAIPVATVAPEQIVTILMTYGIDTRQYAEIRIGEAVDTYTIGDVLPSGHKVKDIGAGYVMLVKGKKGKPEMVKVSRSAAVEVYGSRARSGTIEVPSGSAATPGAAGVAPTASAAFGSPAGQTAIGQLMRQQAPGNSIVPPLPSR